jgi:predicted transcriptional regulator
MRIDFELPKLKYCDGEKKMISVRLTETLLEEIKTFADAHHWSSTFVMELALDQFIQWTKQQAKSKK